jgi:hypothetical protein
MYELKPVFSILLGKGVKYNTLNDFKMPMQLLNESTIDNISFDKSDDEDTLDTDVNTVPVDYEKHSLSNFMKFVRETKKMAEENEKFISLISNFDEEWEEADMDSDN